MAPIKKPMSRGYRPMVNKAKTPSGLIKREELKSQRAKALEIKTLEEAKRKKASETKMDFDSIQREIQETNKKAKRFLEEITRGVPAYKILSNLLRPFFTRLNLHQGQITELLNLALKNYEIISKIIINDPNPENTQYLDNMPNRLLTPFFLQICSDMALKADFDSMKRFLKEMRRLSNIRTVEINKLNQLAYSWILAAKR